MINKSTLSAVASIVDQVNAANVNLGATNESILAALAIASETPLVDHWDEPSGWEAAWCESLCRDQAFGVGGPVMIQSGDEQVLTIPVSLHTSTMDKAISIVAESVKGALSRARNVVKPIVNSVIEDIDQRMTVAQTTVEPYEIVDVHEHDVWKSAIVLGALSKFDSYSKPQPTPRSAIPRLMVPENVASLLQTGSGELDKYVSELLAVCKTSAAEVFSSLFNSTDDLGTIPANYYTARNFTLLQFLMANVLIENPVPGVTMSNMDWTTLTTRMAISLGVACKFMQGMKSTDDKSQRMLYGFDQKSGQFHVNGEVYNKFLTNGGSPELVYGAYMANNSVGDIQYDKMLANAVGYQAAWTRYHTAKKYADDVKYMAMARESVYGALCKAIDTVPCDVLSRGADKSAMMSAAKAAVSKLTHFDIKDLGGVAMCLVCDIMFAHTPSKYLLCRISELCSENVSGEEAATMASIEYVTDWVAATVVLRK